VCFSARGRWITTAASPPNADSIAVDAVFGVARIASLSCQNTIMTSDLSPLNQAKLSAAQEFHLKYAQAGGR
jgi:hypothetical protein